MVASSPAFKLVRFSSVLALSLCATGAYAQSAGASGASSGGATNSGGMGGAGSGGASASGGGGMPNGGASGSTASGGMTAMGGMGGMTAAAGTSAGGAAGMSGNLISNGTFDGTSTSPWWSNANNTADFPADITLAVTNGQLCATMTTGGGQHVWDEIVGLSGVALLPDQYYHIKFTVSADADRTIKFKTGLGTAPYTDYFIEPVQLTANTPQTVEYTYRNLRNDPMGQFQFQIGNEVGWSGNNAGPAGGGTGSVCFDDIVLEPVAPPAMPTYTTPAPSHHPFKDYKNMVKMGTAVDTPIFLSNPLHNAIVAGEFSMITPANTMKMNVIEPTQGMFDYTDTDALLAWAKTNGLEFHGHPLIWHTQTPSWLTDGMFDRDQMIAVMNTHIDGLAGHYAGQMPYWDVVNEAVDNVNGTWTFRSTVWHDTIGDDFIDLAFSHAHEADPSAKLLYNDYNIEQKGNAKADYVFDMISSMKSRGIPIDAVGFQGHYFIEPDGTTANGVPDMQAIRDNMARYASIGVDVHITECDFRIGKPLDDMKTMVQNKFYADMLQACIDAPNCSHFTVWGLSDLDSWVPGTFADYDYAHLFDNKLMPKPDYFAMSAVFGMYNPDGGAGGGSGGMAGATAAAGAAGSTSSAGAGGTGAVVGGGSGGSPGAGSNSGPSSSGPAPKSKSGGCAVTPNASGTAPWLLGTFAVLGLALARRRSKSARS